MARPALLPTCALLGALLLPPAAGALPERVLLLRHGHKSSELVSYNLSPQGLQRALALATLLPGCFGAPTHIRTFYLDPASSQNARSYQTAVPLAVAMGVNIVIDMGSREGSFQVGQTIRTDPAFAGGRVVLFWEHRRLPELAAGLGWPAMPPIPEDDFDQLIELRYRSAEAPPKVRRYSQQKLLSGAQRCPGP